MTLQNTAHLSTTLGGMAVDDFSPRHYFNRSDLPTGKTAYTNNHCTLYTIHMKHSVRTTAVQGRQYTTCQLQKFTHLTTATLCDLFFFF